MTVGPIGWNVYETVGVGVVNASVFDELRRVKQLYCPEMEPYVDPWHSHAYGTEFARNKCRECKWGIYQEVGGNCSKLNRTVENE